MERTPPEVERAFKKATEVKTEEEGEGEAEPEGEAEAEMIVADTGEENMLETVSDIMEEVSNITEQETGSQTETEATIPPTQTRPKTHYGYFTGMITDVPGMTVDEVFVSISRQNFDSGSVRAQGIQYPSTDYIEAVGGSPVYTQPYGNKVVFDNGDRYSNTLGTSYPINDVEIGYNAYMEWGYWTLDKEFLIEPVHIDHKFNNKGYYIYGEYTTDRPTSGSYTYSGDALGTYWTNAGGVDMTGTFNASVNFGSGSISDFDLSVSSSDNSKKAEIQNASGSFASSSFEITGGTWSLTPGGTPTDKACHGSLYGPNGEYIGGAWGMYKSSSDAAEGIFQGSKQ